MTDWATLLATGCRVPTNQPLDYLIDELCAMLAAQDPALRDDIAYPVMVTWLNRGELDGRLRALGDRMVRTLDHPEIQARTFAPMILGWVVLRDARAGGLDRATVLNWRDRFAKWWLTEPDLRGWDDRLGWLHAIAHGSDALRAFARSPWMSGADLCALLDLTVDRLLAPTGYLYAHGEDDRIAYALATILTRRELSTLDSVAWLDRIRVAFASGEPGPVPAWASNTVHTLRALYIATERGVRWYEPQIGGMGNAVPLAHPAEVRLAVVASLREVAPHLG